MGIQNNISLLIDVLKKNENEWIDSNRLAVLLNVTPRSIRNYIKLINKEYTKNNQTYIISSKYGYKINPLFSKTQIMLSNNQKNLTTEIITHLIYTNKNNDLLDLCDTFFISESTLTNQLKKVYTIISKFNLILEQKKNNITILGSEKNKRKLLNFLVFEEKKNYFNSWIYLNRIFPELNLKTFQNELEKILYSNHLYLNDYALINIAIHIAITITRVNKNISISDGLDYKISKKELEKIASYGAIESAYTIAHYTENNFNIILPDADIASIAIIITGNTSEINSNKFRIEKLSTIFDITYLNAIKKALKKITTFFFLDPFDDEFLLKFYIHIFNMLKRISNNLTVNNPLTKNIKSSYPIIYDMALLFTNNLSDELNIDIPEDEIAFIAYHFGAYLEKENDESKKLNCAFIYNEYYDFEFIILKTLKNNFSSELNFIITKPAKYINKFESDIDLVLTTIPNLDIKNTNVITISPLISNKEINQIRKIIQNINLNKHKDLLKLHFERFLSSKFFKKDVYLESSKQYIINMCLELIDNNYITKEFMDDVLLRESICPTAFDNIVAIPHPLNKNSEKSFISLIINSKPIQWANQKVNIVMLIGVEPKDIASFREIFNHLVNVLSNPNNSSLLIHSQSIEEFINNIIEMVD